MRYFRRQQIHACDLGRFAHLRPDARVEEIIGKGRGIIYRGSKTLPAGEVVIVEEALAWTDLDVVHETDPHIVAQKLAHNVLRRGIEPETRHLEPAWTLPCDNHKGSSNFNAHQDSTGSSSALNACESNISKNEFLDHPGRVERQEALAHARIALQQDIASVHCASRSPLPDDGIERLVLAVSLNAHMLKPTKTPLFGYGGCDDTEETAADAAAASAKATGMQQGLFPTYAAMCNHSCRPNMIFQAVAQRHRYEKEEDGNPASQDANASKYAAQAPPLLIVSTVEDVAPGDELTIGYLGSLYLSFPERDERLMETYWFHAEHLPSDSGLEALAPSPRHDRTRETVAANAQAHDAWEAANAIAKQSAGDGVLHKKLQRHRAVAVAKYAFIVRAGLLAETHAWYHNAAYRLAVLLMRTNTIAAAEKVLKLLTSVLASGGRVWPDAWPEHLEILRLKLRAAELTASTDDIADVKRKIQHIETMLGRHGGARSTAATAGGGTPT